MPFTLFHDYFPQVAKKETRYLTLPPDSGFGLPAGSYAFPELFCDEPGCDCRRVMFSVVTSFRGGIQAVVAWGWEDLEFYARWMKFGDRAMAKELKGPVLNMGSPATKLAPGILVLVLEILLRDPVYTERVKRHYRMFRERIDALEEGEDEETKT